MKRSLIKLLVLTCILFSSTVTVLLAGGEKEPVTEVKPEITVYGWAGSWDLWFQDFNKKFKEETGITVNYVSGGTIEMYSKVIAEGDNPKSDVQLISDGYQFSLAAKGFLSDIDWSKVPNSQYYVSDKVKFKNIAGYGFGSYNIGFNDSLIAREEVPRRFEDLADPKWKGRLGLRLPSSVLTGWVWFPLYDKYGEKKATDLVVEMFKNAKSLYQSPGEIIKALAFGEVDLGPALVSHAAMARFDSGGPVSLQVLDVPYFMLCCISVRKNAPNYGGALEFVNFFIGEWCQNYLNEKLANMPVNRNVEPAEKWGILVGEAGVTVEELFNRSYLPDWNYWSAEVEKGVTRLDQVLNTINERVKGITP